MTELELFIEKYNVQAEPGGATLQEVYDIAVELAQAVKADMEAEGK